MEVFWVKEKRWGEAPAWGSFMLLHSENGKYSCTLDSSTKTPRCIIPRYGELPCEPKPTSKSSFLFIFHKFYCRPVSFLFQAGWHQQGCGVEQVLCTLSPGGDGLRTSPSLPARCRAPCQCPGNSPVSLSTQREHRAAQTGSSLPELHAHQLTCL